MSARDLKRILLVLAVAFTGLVGAGSSTVPAVQADGYQRISGEGSSWAANFIDAVRVNVKQFGITVDYNPTGSTAGRKSYLNGTVDFASSDIPFQFTPEDGSAPENPAAGSYAYMPITAGGTAFMYNLIINGKRVTNLRLSGENLAKIFTGAITMWNDPAIQTDNPGLVMPARTVVPVVRSDGSGSTAQFSLWLIHQYPAVWNDFCNRTNRAPACGETSFYPTLPGMIAQNGDIGVAGYVSQSFAEGAIGYVNYSYALNSQFPVAKILNAAGYYTEPTPQNVAVSLLQAKINTDSSNPALYLTQDLSGVYTDPDPRNYQLSSYSYLILPTVVGGQFNEAKGKTLGAFSYYAMCQAQQQSASLGYSPMPINLVQASMDQITKIPGVVVQDINIQSCNNPTFSPDGTNKLALTAPQPKTCDAAGTTMCADGTGGMSNVPTAVSTPAPTNTTPASTTPATTIPASATPVTPTPAGAGGAIDPTVNPSGGGATPSGGGATDAAGGATDSGGGGAQTGVNTPGPVAQGGPVPGGSSAAGGGNPSSGGVIDPATGGVIDPATGGVVDPNAVQQPGVIDPATGQPTGGAVDPDSGAVVPAADQSGVYAPAVGGISTTTLNKASSSGLPVPLVLLVILLLIGLVVAPALAWRHFTEKPPSNPVGAA